MRLGLFALLLFAAVPAHAGELEDFLAAMHAQETAARQTAVDNAKVDTMVVGDSITAVVNTTGMCGKTVNLAVIGYDIHRVIAMLEYAVPLVKPTVVVLGGGTNDDPATYFSYYDPLIQWLLAKGIKPVLAGNIHKPTIRDGVQVRAYFGGWPYVYPVSGPTYTVDAVGHLSEAGKTELYNRVRTACLPLLANP